MKKKNNDFKLCVIIFVIMVLFGITAMIRAEQVNRNEAYYEKSY